MDAQYELTSETGAVKHAALSLYGYYCLRRNKQTGLCFPSLERTCADIGITPKSNVSMLKTFLKNVAWIEVFETGVIRPLKGFYSDEERFVIWRKNFLADWVSVLIYRICVLQNRTLVLQNRTPYIGSLNQPIEPPNLTSSGADSRNGNSAFPTVEKNGDENFPNQPAGKPTPRPPASRLKPADAASAEKPADERIRHPAVKMVRQITGRYPPKDLWDKIIRELSPAPDVEFFQAAWEVWRSFDGKPTNFEKWLFEPNRKNALPVVFGEKYPQNGGELPTKPDWRIVGKSAPTAAPQTVEYDDVPPEDSRLNEALQILVDLTANGVDFSSQEQFYTPEDWAWLMNELNKFESILVEQGS